MLMVYTTRKNDKFGDGGSYCFTNIQWDIWEFYGISHVSHGTFGEFHKRGCAKLDGLPWKSPLKLMIWGTLMT